MSSVKRKRKLPVKRRYNKLKSVSSGKATRRKSQKVEELFATVTASDANVTELLEILSIPEPDLAATAQAFARGLKTRPVIREAFQRLETELPPWLRYHAPAHTDRVFRYAIFLALADKTVSQELELLGLAAAYHDLGYAGTGRGSHEDLGANLAEESMRKGGYSREDIKQVKAAIEDTKLWPSKNKGTLGQDPKSHLGKYLADADLSNFGMNDFLEQSKLVFQEQQFERKGTEVMIHEASREDLLTYLEAVERFFSNHKWHTPAAKRLLGATKKSNGKRLKDAIAALKKIKGPEVPRAFFKRFD